MSSSADRASDHDHSEEEAPHRAGAFDIRTFIAFLIGIYGIVLVLVGLFDSNAAQRAKSDGINVNLWAGLGMVIVAAGFLLWARMRPVVVSKDPEGTEHSEQ